MLGPINGLITGMLTFIVSDIFLGLGPWTFITSTLSGIIGLISGLIWKIKKISKIEVLILSYLLFLIYDILFLLLLTRYPIPSPKLEYFPLLRIRLIRLGEYHFHISV